MSAAEGLTPDGARYAAHLIRKRSKGDRFHPRRPETAAAMLAAAEWLDQFAARDAPLEVGRCGNKAPLVGGPPAFCRLPHGHLGGHRGDDGSEWWITEADAR